MFSFVAAQQRSEIRDQRMLPKFDSWIARSAIQESGSAK
jgi:hypothetical protein